MATENLFHELITQFGESADNPALKKTPQLAADAFCHMTDGYRQNLDEILSGDPEFCSLDNLIVLKNIEFFSLCQSHLLPFSGICHVGYHPAAKVLSISKISRIVEFYSHRLQVQENLTKVIAECIYQAIAPKGVIVEIEAQHMCMMVMGAARQHSSLITQCRLGIFMNAEHQSMFEQKIR